MEYRTSWEAGLYGRTMGYRNIWDTGLHRIPEYMGYRTTWDDEIQDYM